MMKNSLTLFWIFAMSALLSSSTSTVADDGQKIQFVEDFVLAGDRDQAIKSLIPGTDEYYFYQSLHLQNTRQFGAVSQLLNTWRQRHGETQMYREVRNRQMLLAYAQNPKQTLEFLIDELDPKLDHQREQLESNPQLANALDSTLIDFAPVKKRLLRNSSGIDGFLDAALHKLRAEELNAGQRRQLLSRLLRPTHPQLLDMIVADLQYKGSRGFGSLTIHNNLTVEQLELLSARQPSLRNETKFVNAYLRKLQPSPDVEWRHDADEHEAYLQRLWEFVEGLSPSHNSLKALVLYRWLEFDETQGRYDKGRFRAYLELPRPGFYVEPRLIASANSRRYPVDLNMQLSECPLPSIGNDEPLVRRYLLKFFERDNDYRAYAPLIKDDYLKVAFAEAKITHGLGKPDQWYAMISPNQYQELKDRVDIDFAPTNPRVFRSDDPIKLNLLIKNVDKLMVKVYEINTQNFYRDLGREVNTDIELDGLIPNQAFAYEYNETPFIRKARSFEFPQLDKPGVYVIDFIGNGKSSRTVIRKGQLNYLAETTTTGHQFRVLNDRREVVRNSSLWMSGQHYVSNEQGYIQVPFSTKPGTQPIVLRDGILASLQFFDHRTESYKLSVGVHFDRESLLERKEAAILLRPELLLNGTPVSPSILENVAVTVTSTTLDGVHASKQFTDVKLSESQDTPIDIAVPSRLASIHVELTGTITDQRSAVKTYVAAHQVSINQIDKTNSIEDVHLSKIGDQFLLHLLGKTGESRPHRALALQLQHRSFKDSIRVQLATNETGLVKLGPLHDITAITVNTPAGNSKTWSLQGDRRTDPRSLHVLAGETVQVPHMLNSEQLAAESFSLFELRGKTYSRDLTDQIDAQPNFLEIKKLQPGDYSLQVGGQRTLVRVTAGIQESGFAVGPLRRLKLRKLKPLQITSVVTRNDQLEIRLANSSNFARIHVYATRFFPAFDPFDSFSLIAEQEPIAIRAPMAQSFYMAGRKLGDELQYVLERAYAKKFPGNMLKRPSLLLNSWPINDTQTSTQTPTAGEVFDADTATPPNSAHMSAQRKRAQDSMPTDFANLDFLARSSILLANLTVDDEGVVVIPVEKLGPHQHLHVVAIDPLTTVYRSHTLPTLETQHRDLRLVNGLDAEKHYTQRKSTTLLEKGEKFELADITTSEFNTYDSLQRVFDLYATISSDANLAKFQFITDWPKLSSEEKRDKYSEFACHELHFFLYKKDPDFFNEVVRPFLQNKHHKTFMDEFLLDRDLTTYSQPWNFSQLNTVERILLAERLEDSSNNIRRLLADQLASILPDVEREDFLFDTSIMGQALDRSSRAEFDANKRSLMRRDEEKRAGGAGRGVSQRFATSGQELELMEEAMPATDALQAQQRLNREAVNFSNQATPFFAGKAMGGGGFGGRGRQLYEQIDKTKEWAETNYYQLPIAQHIASLVAPGKFWLDFAERDDNQPFFSINWPSATRNFTEMMFALSVLDLPFDGADHNSEFNDKHMTLTANSPLVVFHQQIREAQSLAKDSPILIKQNYFRADDRYEMVQGQRRDKFVTDEFLTHVVYGCQIVLTNPTSSPRQVDVLQQIPHMAISTNGGQATRTAKLQLKPYHTQTLDYFFYFPTAGNYNHFPAHVAQGEDLLGYASPSMLKVVEKFSRIDEASWDYVSQFGSDAAVITYLETHSLLDIDLTKMAFRMAKQPFFSQATSLLNHRHVYQHELWAYSLKHDAPVAIATYLHHSDEFLANCGATLTCELINLNPVDRKIYQHLDYKPLVNARAHRLGDRRQILNDRFHRQYHRLLHVLKYRSELSNEDRITLTYYLLLQDRIEDAKNVFARVERSSLDSKLQYDYFAAYLDCYEDEPTKARAIVREYLNYPVPKWQTAFASINAMLDELDGKEVLVVDPKDKIQTQTAAATAQPHFEFQLEGPRIKVDYQNVDAVKAHYYLVDLELLFSRNPFVQNFDGQFAHVRPNESQNIQLSDEQDHFVFDLPQELQNKNVLVEIEANGVTHAKLYASNSLSVQLSENYGQLKVVETKSGKNLAKTYIKVYAKLKDGSITFYKDGYTDLRGRFDYASLSTNELDQVERFSILVLEDALGGVVREARVPKR